MISPALLLAQAYRDVQDDYRRSLNQTDFPVWDYIILTASDENQAEGYRKQLATRKLPARTHFAVIPDEGNQRVGSGGATLSVIRYVAEHGGLEGKKILCIHSGGDSKRVPQYSALGKLFSPVPHALTEAEEGFGRASSLFDEFLLATASIPSRIGSGMLLLSGDVLLLFNPLLIDYSGHGAAVISFKENVQTGKNHGVYLQGPDGCVRRFLHKQSVETLTQLGAVNEAGDVDIDTGAVIFSTQMLRSLYELIDTPQKYQAMVNPTVRLSLYGDFQYPLATDSTLEDFYLEKPEGSCCEELTAARTLVWKALRPYRMKLLRLAPAKFIHFGTSREILQLMAGSDGAPAGVEHYKELGWRKQVNCSFTDETAGYNSVLSSGAEIGRHCYLETSYVHSRAKVGDGCILSYIDLHDETVPAGTVLHGLKQKDGKFVCRIYGVNDNPKEGLLFGKPLTLVRAETLWDAEIYPVCDTVREAVSTALNVYALVQGGGDLEAWQAAEKKSLKSGFADADPAAIIAWDKRMAELVQMDRIEKAIRNGTPVSHVPRLTAPLTAIQREWLDHRLVKADYSEAMRLHYYIGTALGAEGDTEISRCFEALKTAILNATLTHLKENRTARITVDRHEVRLPLRVNWGGGWSDTPPYCNERGGTVLNAAIRLNGALPVFAGLERIPEKKVVFDSRDMDVHGEFTEIEPLQATGDPYDSFALQKAALLACGILPPAGGNLVEILERLGGGFVLHSEVTGVPKGSGLGTSSILAGACVKAIFEFFGIAYGEDDLYATVLAMEQIMSTGGGWQDQVGGLSDGIKYITARPGIDQVIHVQHVQLDPETEKELHDRFCLIYTGQRRLARNLLRDVVGRYVGNEPESLYALNEIQRVAALMRFELERGHVDEFAKLLDEHWKLSNKVDAGSTNTLIDQIFDCIGDLVDGKMICGAGGGGFLQVIMKKGVRCEDIHRRLKEIFADSPIDVWDCELC